MKSKLYIAYGSNLNLQQMKHRCPTAEVVGKTALPDYKLVFRRRVATVEPENGSSVPVLVWRIYPRDEVALDSYEGVPVLYHKETISVELNGQTVSGMIYLMNDGFPVEPPASAYFNTILEGYRSAGFNESALREAAYGSTKKERLITDRIREQIMTIRDSGETNMLDTRTVQYLAYHRDFYELVCFIEDHRKEYVHFILTGEEG